MTGVTTHQSPLGMALSLLALGAGIPPILRAAHTIDRAHFALGGATDWLSPRRLIDVAQEQWSA